MIQHSRTALTLVGQCRDVLLSEQNTLGLTPEINKFLRYASSGDVGKLSSLYITLKHAIDSISPIYDLTHDQKMILGSALIELAKTTPKSCGGELN